MGKGKRRAEPTDLNSETTEEWEHLKSQPGVIIVDVYTKWAGPCHIMKPVISKIKLKVSSSFQSTSLLYSDLYPTLSYFL